METRIFATFAGMGKTTFAKNNSKALDLESSNYKWLYDEEVNKLSVEERKGTSGRTLNPEWPGNYVQAIKDNIGKYLTILISMDIDVRKMLYNQDIDFDIVIPKKEDKYKYIQRFKDRGNQESFIKLMEDNYEKWINDIMGEEDNYFTLYYEINGDEYLSDQPFIKFRV